MKTRLLFAPLLIAAAAATPLAAAQAASVKLTSTLSGAGADTDGTGAFAAEVDADAGDFCYTLTVAKIAKPTMAHVHTGAAGTNGPPVVTVDVTGTTDECVAVEPDVLKAIVANPAGYYVNVHTADFPAGAIRGQLATK
ncbi:CHRD domain-containing protein [Novosphingobium sp. JCM 18896]|uniref:CHRD domain-containing protein n=1 Tax=Novosphingobium sp. JCM 18896 TaxID=2989731 RepID=UPI00222243FD|nr:CHRD domain-containing protein [Novosphingobium sp. JCM 18896]MCW1430026.1 CHRD domain-containing protein [Novosphingobium sp. JCM 18896]